MSTNEKLTALPTLCLTNHASQLKRRLQRGVKQANKLHGLGTERGLLFGKSVCIAGKKFLLVGEVWPSCPNAQCWTRSLWPKNECMCASIVFALRQHGKVKCCRALAPWDLCSDSAKVSQQQPQLLFFFFPFSHSYATWAHDRLQLKPGWTINIDIDYEPPGTLLPWGF